MHRPTLSTRTRYALVGLFVGLACAGFIVYRLVQASAPQATTLQFTNASATAIRVASLSLGPEPVLTVETPFPAPAAGRSPAPFESRAVPLPPGRPVAVAARLAGEPGPRTCSLEPRPQGVCVVKFAVTDDAAPRCEYACRSAEGK